MENQPEPMMGMILEQEIISEAAGKERGNKEWGQMDLRKMDRTLGTSQEQNEDIEIRETHQ